MTADRILLAFATPVAGREEEFRTWYWGTHVQEVLALPGFVAAEPYYLADEPSPIAPYRYVTVYTVEGAPEEARDRMFAGGLGSSDAMDTSAVLVAPFLARALVDGA
jgi:hypothetical protein